MKSTDIYMEQKKVKNVQIPISDKVILTVH